MSSRRPPVSKESLNGMSLDIEWGELESEDSSVNASASRLRPGSRAVSSRASSSRSLQSSTDYYQPWKQKNNIQIIPDGFDDEDVSTVESAIRNETYYCMFLIS